MKRPQDLGSKIGAQRYKRWLAHFVGYWSPVTQPLIELWLKQFSTKDRDLAARVLDAVLFLGHQHIHSCFKQLLEGLDGWHISPTKRKGKWFFVPFSGSVGESGDSMVHTFRMAAAMTNRKLNPLFIHRSELVAKKLQADDTVVLIDDFSGSGKQACDSWKDMFAELLAGGPRIILMLVAATTKALERISVETEIEPLCGIKLQSSDDIFSNECKHFTDSEKSVLFKYCQRADRTNPRGFRECGLVVVLSHRCPNNSIPVLHASHSKWQGLFPRHD